MDDNGRRHKSIFWWNLIVAVYGVTLLIGRSPSFLRISRAIAPRGPPGTLRCGEHFPSPARLLPRRPASLRTRLKSPSAFFRTRGLQVECAQRRARGASVRTAARSLAASIDVSTTLHASDNSQIGRSCRAHSLMADEYAQLFEWLFQRAGRKYVRKLPFSSSRF
jgi:hypothetical protein